MSSQLRVDNILPSAGTALGIGTASGSITFNSSISGDVIFNNDVTVNGLLTYEDVTNIDSVGVITARDGLHVTGGNLGVGLNNPNTTLHLSSATPIIKLQDSDSTGNAALQRIDAVNSGGTTQWFVGQNSTSTTELWIQNVTNDDIRFGTNNTERLRITSAGRIGINQTSPGAMLQVDYDEGSSEVGLRLRAYNASGTKTWQLSEINGNAGVFTIRNATNSQDILSIDGVNQRVGVNNTSPSVNLHVKGSASNGQIYLGGTGAHSQIYADNDGVLILNADQGNSAANSYLGFNVDNTERLRISSNGAVCIGSGYQSSGGGQLTIRGLGVNSYAVQDYQYVGTPSGGTTLSQIRFTANTSGSSVIGGARIQAAADDDWSATGDAPTRLQFYTTPNGSSSQAERLRIDSNGRQYHYTDGSLRMHLNATGLGVNTTTITGGRLIHAHNTGTGSAYFQSTNSNTGEGSSSGALFGVSGTTCYAPWNYINGPVVFATNASEKMRIHATGEVTKSSQPLAIIGTTQNNWVPSAGDVLPFNYTNTNRGNHYNTSNYTFTCPVAGDYMVILRLSRKGFRGDLELAKNNGQYALLELRETGRNNSSAADWQAWCYDFIVPCAANDTLKWKAPNVYTGTGGGNYLLDGLNHIYYDSVTYYLMG